MCYNKVWILVCIFLLLCSCGRDFNNPVDPVNTATGSLDLEAAFATFLTGDYQKALEMYQSIYEQDPDTLESLNGLGWSYLRLHLLVEARDAFRESAATKDPVDREALTALSGLLLLDPVLDAEEAVQSGSELVDADPLFISSYDKTVSVRQVRMALAEGYLYQGKYNDVTAQLKLLGQPPKSDDIADLLEALQILQQNVQLVDEP